MGVSQRKCGAVLRVLGCSLSRAKQLFRFAFFEIDDLDFRLCSLIVGIGCG